MIDAYTDNLTLQAEYSVIGAAILYLPVAKKYTQTLQASDFSDGQCRRMWEIICAVERQEEIYSVSRRAGISAVDVSRYQDAPLAREPYFPWLVERIKLYASDRKLRANIIQLMDECVPEELPQKLAEAIESTGRLGLADLDNMPEEQIKSVLQGMENHDTRERIKTGYPVFDGLTGGLRPGSVSVIGALPSAGKTALALNILCKAVADGKKAAFFSLEMNNGQLWERLAAHGASVSYQLMGERNLDETSFRRMKGFLSAAASSKQVWLFDDCRFVEQQADRIIRLSPQLIVVDYLQLVATKAKHNSSWERLEYLIAEYKRLALANNCHICILSQHNRAGTGEKASMFSLKGSSAIEQGGDYVAILDRPNVYDDSQPAVKAEFKLVKNKYGCVGSLPLWFDGDYQRFRILAEGEAFPELCKVKEEKPF